MQTDRTHLVLKSNWRSKQRSTPKQNRKLHQSNKRSEGGQAEAQPLTKQTEMAAISWFAKAADAIEAAVEKVLDQGLRTGDIYTEGTRKVSTGEMGSAVAEALAGV